MVKDVISVEQFRPSAIYLLNFAIVIGKHQRRFSGFVLRCLPRSQRNSLADINRIEESSQFFRVKIFRFAEDHHLWMVIDRESLFRELIVKLPTPQSRVGGEDFHQFKAKLPLKHARFRQVVTGHGFHIGRAAYQRAVISRAQWIPFRHTWDGAPLAIGAHKDVFALAEHLEVTVALCLVIRRVHVQVQVTSKNASGSVIRNVAVHHQR